MEKPMSREQVERVVRATLLEWGGLEAGDVDWKGLVDAVMDRLGG